MRVFAPGKLFLVGEYAAVDGGPAVVAAVNRGVSCEIRPGAGIETPGDDRFVRAALSAVDAPPRLYHFSDWNPVDLPGKPGFGGSAAAVVAAAAAGRLADGHDLDGLEAVAVAVHHQVQGSGSGLDVRASVRGGVHRFDLSGATPLPHPPLTAVYSGASASTAARVLRYRAWAGRDAFLVESARIVDAFSLDPVSALRESYRLLCAMALQAGVDYDTPAFRALAQLASDFGGAAKPSGAGGGDVAVAVIPDPDARAAFCAACAQRGLPPIPVEIPGGVSCL